MATAQERIDKLLAHIPNLEDLESRLDSHLPELIKNCIAKYVNAIPRMDIFIAMTNCGALIYQKSVNSPDLLLGMSIPVGTACVGEDHAEIHLVYNPVFDHTGWLKFDQSLIVPKSLKLCKEANAFLSQSDLHDDLLLRGGTGHSMLAFGPTISNVSLALRSLTQDNRRNCRAIVRAFIALYGK